MIQIKLKEILEKNKISRYKLEQYTDLSYRRINDYYFNRVEFIKIEELEQLCEVLECNIQDILEYKKNKK